MKALIAFFVLGLIFGVGLNFATLLGVFFRNRIIQFVIDFVVMICFSVLYFCITLAYMDGEYRFYDSVAAFLGFLLYFVTIYLPTTRILNKKSGKLNKWVKTVSKKWNFDEKSFKKVLRC